MEARIERLKFIYACFVDRPIDGALVVRTDDLASVFVAHVVDDFDARSPTDIAFSTTAPFTTFVALADHLVQMIQAQQRALAGREVEDEDRAALGALVAPLPPICSDRSAAPAARIQALFDEVHVRVSAEDRRITWCIAPTEICDPGGYAEVMRALLTMRRPPGLRLVLRDLKDAPCVEPSLTAPDDESIVTAEFWFTLDEAKALTARRAADPSQPPAIRMPAILEVALTDLGAGRLGDAALKFRYLLAEGVGCPPGLRPLARYGLAEIAQRQGELPLARQHLEVALGELSEAKAPPIQYTIVEALARVAAALGEYELAEDCYACAAALSAALRSNEACAGNLEALGDVRLARENFVDARDAWASAADLWHEDGSEARERALRQKIEDLDGRARR